MQFGLHRTDRDFAYDKEAGEISLIEVEIINQDILQSLGNEIN